MMNNSQGWVKVYRQLTDNQIWQEQPFSKGQAWIDILIMVNFEAGQTIINNQTIDILPGQKVTSIKHLSERWGWSRKRTKNFLDLLKNLQMLDFSSTTKYTVLTVMKWDFFQSTNDSRGKQKNINGTSTEHQKNIKRTQYKNIKNIKNDKERKPAHAKGMTLEEIIQREKELRE